LKFFGDEYEKSPHIELNPPLRDGRERFELEPPVHGRLDPSRHWQHEAAAHEQKQADAALNFYEKRPALSPPVAAREDPMPSYGTRLAQR